MNWFGRLLGHNAWFEPMLFAENWEYSGEKWGAPGCMPLSSRCPFMCSCQGKSPDRNPPATCSPKITTPPCFSTMSRLPLLSLSSRYLLTSARSPALSPLARPVAESISTAWKGTSMTGGTTKNFIGGQFLESKADTWLDVFDPVCPLQSLVVQHSSGHPHTVNANPALKSSSDHSRRIRAGRQRRRACLQLVEQDQRTYPPTLRPRVSPELVLCPKMKLTLLGFSISYAAMPTLSLGALFLNKARHWQVHLFPDRANKGHQHNCIDAHGDLLRGLQVAESAIAATATLLADKLEGPYVLFADMCG